MSNNDYYEYNLDSAERKQLLSIGIEGNNISIVLQNKSGNNERYSSLVNLSQLTDACKIFEELNSLKDALDLLHDTIEAGNIFLTPQEDSFILKIIIKTEEEEFPPFQIILALEDDNGNTNNNNNNNQELPEAQRAQYDVLPVKFDYQGNVEAEEKYGKSTKNTTEYNKPKIISDYKKPIVQLEYIEPILQVHYPDGTTKSKALPPRIQSTDGKTKISQEQFTYIREQMNRNTESKIRANSVVNNKQTSKYSLQSVPTPNYNNIFSNMAYNDNSQVQGDIQQVEPQQYTNNYTNATSNNKFVSQYSTRSVNNKTSYDDSNSYSNNLHPQQMYNTYTYNRDNMNKTIEVAPRMINQNQGNNNPLLQNSIKYHKPIVETKVNPVIYAGNNQNINDIMNHIPSKSQAMPNMRPINQSQMQSTPTKSQRMNQTQINNSSNSGNKNFSLFATVKPMKRIQRPPNLQSKSMIQQRQNIMQNNIQNIQPIQSFQQQQYQIPQIQQPQYENNIPQYENNLPQYDNNIPNMQMMPQYLNNQAPEEFDMKHQKERFQAQLKIQQQIVDSKTPVFPSVLPTKIWDTKFEFPQGRDYEERIIEEIKSKNQVVNDPYGIYSDIGNQQYINNNEQYETSQQQIQGFSNTKYRNEKQTQKKMKFSQPKVLPIIYDGGVADQEGNVNNNNINAQIVQQLQSYNQQNIETMDQNNVEEGNLENNEIIEDNENDQQQIVYADNNEQQEEGNDEQQGQEQEENAVEGEEGEDDIEQLFKTEDGLIIFRNGILRGIIHRYSEIDGVITKIQNKLCKGAKFNLIYRAFSDGDKASSFHEKCDNHQMTLVLIETQEGVRFGGFTTKKWDGKNLKKIDDDAFVFSIETGKCFDITKGEPAIGCYPKFGPVFFGCQIRIYDEFFTKGGTTCLKGLNYCTTKDYELNNGERTYIVKDIEVYEIETIDI